jgi:hypothetical protein
MFILLVTKILTIHMILDYKLKQMVAQIMRESQQLKCLFENQMCPYFSLALYFYFWYYWHGSGLNQANQVIQWLAHKIMIQRGTGKILKHCHSQKKNKNNKK